MPGKWFPERNSDDSDDVWLVAGDGHVVLFYMLNKDDAEEMNSTFFLLALVKLAAPFTDGAILQRDMRVPIWGTGAAGETVRVSFAGQERTTVVGADGRWRVDLEPLAASSEGRDLTANDLTVRDVLVGEVWLCSGQSNMAVPLWGDSPRARDRLGGQVGPITTRPTLRFAKLRNGWNDVPQTDETIVWERALPAFLTSGDVSAVAFWYGQYLQGALNVPIGLFEACVGATDIETWIPDCRASCPPAHAGKGGLQPAQYHNGKVAPICPYALRGAIWYQGESNTFESEIPKYPSRMRELLQGWKRVFANPRFRLYFAQLCPWGNPLVPAMQEAQQRFAESEPDAGMAVLCDVGNIHDIHPNDKQVVGLRLALLALKRDYGFTDLVADSPVLRSWRVEDGRFLLDFDHVTRWSVYDPDWRTQRDVANSRDYGFEVAGADGVWVKAQIGNFRQAEDSVRPEYRGQITNRTLVVFAPEVRAPRALRYLHSAPWRGFLMNEAGLPVGAFHVDHPSVRIEPRDAPETWFHVIGGNASKEGLSADVQAIAAAGLGGIQFFHGRAVGLDPKPWPGVKEQIPCLSPKWGGLVSHLADECAARGLSFKLQNCPGWSMSGGPWVPKEKAMRTLVAFPPGRKPRFDADDDYREIGEVTFPAPVGEAETALLPDAVETNGDVRVFRFARPVTVRTVTLTNPQRLNHDWCYEPKIRFRLEADGAVALDRDCPAGAWFDEADMTFSVTAHTAAVWRLSVAHVHPLKRFPEVRFSAAARLDGWEAKVGLALREFTMGTDAAPVETDGSRTLVFGHCNAKRRNGPAPAEATGWECDKMDPAGFEANYAGYVRRLLSGPLAGQRVEGLVVDSWECGPARWTPKMEEAFQRQNGYALRPWLPALFGYVLGSVSETERFLLDWRRTCSRLVEDNYYGTIARLAKADGLSVQYETAFGDVLTGDLLRFWKYADEPMCEFWSPFDDANGYVTSYNFKPVRPCVSAAHLYGKRRVSAEAFTSARLTFDETLQGLKEDANLHLCRGVTHLVFHTYTHNPVVKGLPPGSSFGCGIGTPFLRGQTWWPFMPGFTRYLAVCGHELERGTPVVDVLWYLGDALGHKPDERGDRFGPGYKYDYLNRDVLETRLTVRDGRFVLPDGLGYRVLWIPDGTFLLPETRRRLATLEAMGGRIVYGDFTPDWPADVAGAPYWYHRRDGDESIYFLANFRQPFKGVVRLRDWPRPIDLELAPGEGRFVYVKGDTLRMMEPETGRTRFDATACGEQALEGWSRPLGLWRDLPGTYAEKGFSGTRRYDCKVTRPFPASDARSIVLDLGEVTSCCARVLVNGREVAKIWSAPARVDVTESLKDGVNEIAVDVTSTWHNRLIVDAGLPEGERQTWTILNWRGPQRGQAFAPSGWVGPARFVFLRDDGTKGQCR